MNKFFAAGLMAALVSAFTAAPSMAGPYDGHGRDRHNGYGPRGAAMQRRGGGIQQDIRRQQALVNTLQERVDRDRQYKRTKTAMYTRNLADLRAAQAKLKAMEVRAY